MQTVADEIGAPSGPRIQQGGLRVYTIEPDPDELPMMRRYLGFEPVFARADPMRSSPTASEACCAPPPL